MERNRIMRSWALVLLLATFACTEAQEPDGAGEPAAAADTTGDPHAEAAAMAEMALPGLFDIMMGLQADMYRVSRGLWLARPDTVARGARSIADHPRIPADEIRVIRDLLGDDTGRFQELDRRVHDLAVQLAEAADAGDMEAVLTTEAELRSGCLQCHEEFRERIRDGLR